MSDLEALIVEELKKHSDIDYSWGKWYCKCGNRLRGGSAEWAIHRQDVERRLREEDRRG